MMYYFALIFLILLTILMATLVFSSVIMLLFKMYPWEFILKIRRKNDRYKRNA